MNRGVAFGRRDGYQSLCTGEVKRDESQGVGETHLREVQDRQKKGRGSSDMLEPQTQATARLTGWR